MKTKRYIVEILVFAGIFALVLACFYFFSKKVTESTQRDATRVLKQELEKSKKSPPRKALRAEPEVEDAAPAPAAVSALQNDQTPAVQPQKVRVREGVVESEDLRRAKTAVEAIDTYYPNVK